MYLNLALITTEQITIFDKLTVFYFNFQMLKIYFKIHSKLKMHFGQMFFFI